MNIKINIPHFLHQYTNGQQVVYVEGSTVGQCLAHVVKQFPNVEQGLFDIDGKLHGYIDVCVNGKSSYPEELDKPVKPSDELYILVTIEGG